MFDIPPQTSQSSPPDDFPIGSHLRLEDRWYEIKSFLGKGGFAKVYQARSMHENFDYAVKIVRRKRRDDPNDHKIRREVAIQSGCANPNIVHVYFATNDPAHYFIATEICGQTLLDFINEAHSASNYINESTCRNFTSDILDANLYLSNQGVIHRDIKPGNIFLTLNTDKGLEEHVKLGDFGLAVYKQDLNPNSVSGTPNYLAPEVLCRLGHSEKSEVWSLACVLYCMLFGKPPFETDSVQTTYDRISKNMWSFPYGDQYSPQVKQLIQCCLTSDRHRRYSFHQMLQHEWLESYSLRNRGRTKSLFNLPNGSDNFTKPPSARPRSVLDEFPQSILRRSKPTFMAGSSHDSGIGSDENLCRQNRLKMETSLNFFMGVVGRYISGSIRLASTSSTNAVFVSKWVDYTNRCGFACELNDGIFAMKFIQPDGGGCLSWSRVSDHVVYSTSTYSAPRSYAKYSEEVEPDVYRKILTAKEYQTYMELHLSNTGRNTTYYYCSDEHVPFLLHHQIVQNKYLIMVFSNNLIQINFFRERIKIVLVAKPDGYCREEDFRLYVICPDGTLVGYKCSAVDEIDNLEFVDYIPDFYLHMMNVHDLLKHDCEVTPKFRTSFPPMVTAC